MVEREGLSALMHIPVIQAPMAGVSTPELAAAVSNAGGLGSIAIGANRLEDADAQILRTRELTARPFNVNVFCHQPAQSDPARETAWLARLAPRFREYGAEPLESLSLPYLSFVENPDMLTLLLKRQPAVVSFHFGLPSREWIEQLKAAGIYLLATATNLAEAQEIEAAGVDAIVAQGREAGGHSGVFDPVPGEPEWGTLPLVQLITQSTRLPVIAAGGVMDGRGVRAALALGASAVQMGTAFILCPESAADTAYRDALRPGAATETRITRVISGRPARGLVDRWWAEVDTQDEGAVPDYPRGYVAGKALKAAARQAGQHGFNAHWAGQGAALIRAMPAAEMVSLLAAELNESR